MNEARIMEILIDWNLWGNFKEDLHVRPAYLSKLADIVGKGTATSLLGVRRAGKSSLGYLFIRNLLKEGKIQPKDSLIVNLEDPRFPSQMNSDDLIQIYELYLRRLEPSRQVILLDEVQNVSGWERVVRYLLEAKRAQVLITGSASRVLGREVPTVLTGRHVDVEVFPLSFTEFLEFKGIPAGTPTEMAKNRLKIQRALEEYVRWGGFPEVVLSESEARKRELLLRYFEDILAKDVVRRFRVREIKKLEDLADIYLSNICLLYTSPSPRDRG